MRNQAGELDGARLKTGAVQMMEQLDGQQERKADCLKGEILRDTQIVSIKEGVLAGL